RARIELTAQKGSINFGSGVTCDELRLFEIEKVGKKSPSDIRDVTHRLRTDAEAGLRPKFFEIVQPKFFARVDGLVARGFRRAEIDKFIEIVEYAAFAHNVERDNAAAHGADRQAVGPRCAEHIVGRFAPAAAVHIFEHQRGIPGNVLAQEGY